MPIWQHCCLFRTTLGEARAAGCAQQHCYGDVVLSAVSDMLDTCSLLSFWLSGNGKKKSEYSCQGSKVKLMGLAVSVILNKSKMCLSAHQEREMPFGCSLTSFYLCTSILMISLRWPPCVLWGSTVQMVLRGTSLVSPLVLAKSKHGAVPSAKCSL